MLGGFEMPYQSLKFCGRLLDDEESELILELTREFWGIARSELANTICELLDWKRPNGKLKSIECIQFLEDLEEKGILSLPRKRPCIRGKDKPITQTRAKQGQQPIKGTLGEIGGVGIERVVSPGDQQTFKELVDRYHYLGYKTPFGARLRYLVKDGNRDRLLGCLQYSSPAWKVAVRDDWIGWNAVQREARLQLIVQNSRFLILPWVEVKNLASHLLGRLSHRVALDWQDLYGYQPVLLETFVDERFPGTSYQAANWQKLGQTQGRGRMDREHRRQLPAKTVWVYPLHRRARVLLRDCQP
jgi:hypothetical protein